MFVFDELQEHINKTQADRMKEIDFIYCYCCSKVNKATAITKPLRKNFYLLQIQLSIFFEIIKNVLPAGFLHY